MTATSSVPATRPPVRALTWGHTRLASAVRAVGMRALLTPALHTWCRPFTVHGADRLDALEGPAIFVANHSSHLDTVAVLVALPARLRRTVAVAAARDYFFARAPLGALVSLAVNAFPIDRHGGDPRGLVVPRAMLRCGWSLLIYPEGTRSTTGAVGAFHTGAVRLASDAGVPIVPIHLEGTARSLPKGRSVPRPAAVTVHVGEPVRVGRDQSPRRAADELRARVLALTAATERGLPMRTT